MIAPGRYIHSLLLALAFPTTCYDVYRDGEQIIWVNPDSGNRYGSVLMVGKAVPW
jgi:hypothetical protein